MTGRVALVFHGDREVRDRIVLAEHRLGKTADALRAVGLRPEAAVYNDDFADEVFDQLRSVDAVLVWVNPIEGDRDRSKLDAMLARVSEKGVLVSAHPETIQKMGTKEVLYHTRGMTWGSDVDVYRTPAELRARLAAKLASGKPRVIKQRRGHSGLGVWKVSPISNDPHRVRARHAQRGSIEREMPLDEFFGIAEGYLAGEGLVVDQEYMERLTDGTIRCYMVKDQVAGFGRQEINALFPAGVDAPADEAPQPGPRLYHPPSNPDFAAVKRRMEDDWLPDLLRTLRMGADELPLLWDADFFYGPKDEKGEDSFVLGEINVSSVYPYPESAAEPLAAATLAAINGRR